MRKMTEQQFDDVIEVHLRGCWNGTRQAATIMRETGGGSIINMSSISAKVGFIGQTNHSAAKALLRCLLGMGAEIEWRLNQRFGKRSPKRHRRKGTPSRLAKGWNPATKVNDS